MPSREREHVNTSCNLIIDSCCDLPFALVDVPGVELFKFPFSSQGKEYFGDLYAQGSAHEFFEAMRKGAQPSTAQIPYGVMLQTFEEACASGIPTVYLAFSSALSGNFSTAEMIAQDLSERYPDAELHIVDTKLASIAEGLLVHEALRLRDTGMSAADLAAWAREARYFVNAKFMVDDLEALSRGGRLSQTAAFAGGKLDVKPLLSFDLDGSLALAGLARGRKKGLRMLVEHYVKHTDPSQTNTMILVADADCPKDADKLKEFLLKDDENVFFLESDIGPVIGSHVGPGMVALAFWGTDRREDLSVADRIARKVKNQQ